MKLEFEKGSAIEDPSNADLANTIPEVGGQRGSFAILSDTEAENDFIQVSGSKESKFALEYREAGKQYRAVEPASLEEVIASFQDYAWGKSDWRERHRWTELEFSANEGGCLASIVAVAIALMSFAAMAV